MRAIYLNVLLFVFTGISVSCNAQQVVKSNDRNILYTGRVAVSDTAAMLSWSGTSVKLNFNGTIVKALIGDEYGENYYNIIVDGNILSVLHLAKGKNEYTLLSGLKPGKHSLELFKRTEWAMGRTMLYSFTFDHDKALLAPPIAKKRKIEYFGDSITCGYAVEDSTGQDRGTAPYENGYISYAAITARHFNADFHSTSKSGIGITISWFPLVMPEMYDRLDPFDATSKWDFTKYIPDVVVINLFQNDSWLVKQPEFAEFKARFGTTPPTAEFVIDTYADLVKKIRVKYPKAQIICALGNMDATSPGSVWPGYIEKAVTKVNDTQVHTLIFPAKKTPGHPNPAEQQAMADDLIKFIDKTVKW
ncbi:MAG: SGNH/GDSL hydrolase family protein [Mucilaginibacter sp.]